MKHNLYPYQVNAIEQVEQLLLLNNKAVLAGCPSSGKTRMALELIERNPTKTFFILAHATNLIKKQWFDVLAENGFGGEVSDVIGQARITYGIPQQFQSKAKLHPIKPIDYLIIDEAHEYTDAKMIAKIVESIRPRNTVYLTGTPSNFVLKDIPLVVIPGVDLINEGRLSKLYLGLISTNANILTSDHNRDGDITKKGSAKLELSVDSDLDMVLKQMYERLRGTDFFKSSPELWKKVQWAPTLGKLHKTMFACTSIAQANKVYEYFIKLGINAVMSHSQNDPNTLNIARFIDESDIKILIVVDRGILAFNMPDLVNVVDMTGSKNINLIYQLFGRVLRKNDKIPLKYYFKLAPESQTYLFHLALNASLHLMTDYFIRKYNGKNLKTMDILIRKTPKQSEGPLLDEPESNKRAKGVSGKVLIDDFLIEAMSLNQFVIHIDNQIGQPHNEYCFSTTDEVRARDLGEPSLVTTEADILHYIANGVWPEVSLG